jgi:hypothetical protein
VEARHALMLKVFDLWGPSPSKGRDWSRELRTLYGDMQTKATLAAKAADAKRVTGTKPTLPLARYAGVYADSLYGDVTVTAAGGGLRLKAGTLEASLEHWQYDTFRIQWDNRWQGEGLLSFILGTDGAPSRVEIDGRTFARTDRGQ